MQSTSNKTIEYAEQYTQQERVRFLVAGISLGGGFLFAWKSWLLPRWVEFVNKSPCYELWDINGTAVVFYSLFVGLPLVSGLMVAIFVSRRGVKILRDKQVPFKGEKVFRPTRVRRGSTATLVGWLHVTAPVIFLLIALWGAPHARDLAKGFDARTFDYSKCHVAPPKRAGQGVP